LERTLLQVALADPDATVDTLRSTCEELVASGQEQERLLEALLTLASSERGLDHREPVDLSVSASHVLSSARPEIDRLGLQIETTLAAAPTSGDLALVERLIANLVDNAVRYNEPGGRIELRTETRSGHPLVSVTNTGPWCQPTKSTGCSNPSSDSKPAARCPAPPVTDLACRSSARSPPPTTPRSLPSRSREAASR
jgi:K+-sensing histidine kinase KdpD